MTLSQYCTSATRAPTHAAVSSCVHVLLCWHELYRVSTQRYIRDLEYKSATGTLHHTLSTHRITPSPTVIYLVHNIRHNSNKLHLGEYSPPSWINLCVEPPCTLDLRLYYEHRCYSQTSRDFICNCSPFFS